MGNHNSGRRPQPTVLKMLRGNPGKRKPSELEPIPVPGEVVKPAGLSAGASAVWDELAPICLAMRTLTRSDVMVFGTMCELQSTLLKASAAKDGEGFKPFKLRTKNRNDDQEEATEFVVEIDDILKLERDTAVALRPYYALFGLEPVSRARISVPKKQAEEPVSKWAGVLK